MSYTLDTAIQRVKFAREAGAIRRLHIHKIIGEYDIAQHTFGALCLLRVLNPLASVNLVWAVLSHDKPERLTGDIPSPAKYHGRWFIAEAYQEHENEILTGSGFVWDKLTEEESYWLKAVDSLEFWLFCLDQAMLGNQTLVKPKRKIERYIQLEIDKWPPVAQAFFNQMKDNPTAWEMCDELG